MKRLTLLAATVALAMSALHAGITVSFRHTPAAEAFAEVMRQDGGNFVYSSGLLNGLTVTLTATDEPLDAVLDGMFASTPVTWRRVGRNVVLSRRRSSLAVGGTVTEAGSMEPLAGVAVTTASGRTGTLTNALGQYSLTVPDTVTSITFRCVGFEPRTIAIPTTHDTDRNLNVSLTPAAGMLEEVTAWGSINRSLSIEGARIGELNLSNADIERTPVIFGESDVIKTLQLEPGVSAGVEGMAGMYVHGGNVDENQYMLDNIPLYQVNHFGGLFSAFNVGAIRNVNFYKSSFPARFDGRLSSYMDVRTLDGSAERHNGSVSLGLTSGAVAVNGPLWRDRTTYSVALRRSWYDLLTAPTFAIVNALSKHTDYSLGYAFTDLNAKLSHKLDPHTELHLMCYYGDDYVRMTETHEGESSPGAFDAFRNRLRWGNLVVSAGLRRMFTSRLFGEFTAAYTRFSSRMVHGWETGERTDGELTDYSSDDITSTNSVADVIVKADFAWHPAARHSFEFGAAYTRHSFLPGNTRRTLRALDFEAVVTDEVTRLGADHTDLYFGGDWQPSDALRVNYGAHFSLFAIDGRTHTALSPRLSARWTPAPGWAVKGGYSHTAQYVHQLLQSSISLPTDQWVPIVGAQKPQTAHKVALGLYRELGRHYTLSVEGYWKWMDRLLDYADAYYLLPPDTQWADKLTSGRGTAKGIDLKLTREFGKLTGHVAYSLMWADRTFDRRNGGRKFPARYDNRHKINIVLNWKISDRWEAGVTWTGMSGNRITLPLQCWDDPALGPWHYDMALATDVNNYRLPFYHRMDIAFRRYTAHGHWEFSLYNAYCNMNTIGVQRDYSDRYSVDYHAYPAFRKIKLIPTIPSVSYTWNF